MITERELRERVEAAFEPARLGLGPWPDPNPDRSPPEAAYSRLTDPERWAILGARADAWVTALVGLGVAHLAEPVEPAWAEERALEMTSTVRLVPSVDGALPLTIARTRLGPARDAGVMLGVGDPATALGPFPDCGCDACDSGSQDALDELDTHVLGVVSGVFRRLRRPGAPRRVGPWRTGPQVITVIERDGWSARNLAGRRDEVVRALADPTGWDELSGPSWLGG